MRSATTLSPTTLRTPTNGCVEHTVQHELNLGNVPAPQKKFNTIILRIAHKEVIIPPVNTNPLSHLINVELHCKNWGVLELLRQASLSHLFLYSGYNPRP